MTHECRKKDMWYEATHYIFYAAANVLNEVSWLRAPGIQSTVWD